MPILTVKLENGERRIPFDIGRSLRDILDTTNLRVRSGCGGLGACGLCRVHMEAGEGGEPTSNEQVYLDFHELDQGIRLACQVMPEEDVKIIVLSPARQSRWITLHDTAGPPHIGRRPLGPLKDLPPDVMTPYGAAVDLGTTHISLSLYDLSSGRWVAGRYGRNPQMRYGADVMTRLVAASQFPDQADTMGQEVVEAIHDALFDIAVREGINIEQVIYLTLVGNTAMLALLSGRNSGMLLQPDYWMCPVDCMPDSTDAWGRAWRIHPRARIDVIPPLAGFVGSDLLAGVVSTRLKETGAGGLFIDFGTNSEIALWDGRILWVTSAAGGPAFEGGGIRCGVPAEPGAVYRVNFRKGMPELGVITDREPCGICGSGLVDLIAGLIRSGDLTRMGRFAPSVPPKGYRLTEDGQGLDLFLTKKDVDLIQRAKAAIASGIQVLLTQAAMEHKDVRRICVGGVFGCFLNIVNAQAIGLLPMISPDLIEFCGNTALAGCADILLSPAAIGQIKDLRDRARLVNLSLWPDFDDLFLTHLYLQPMQGD